MRNFCRGILFVAFLAGGIFYLKADDKPLYFTEEQNVSTDKNVSQIPGLVQWLRADKGTELDDQGRVVNWFDQSMNLNGVTQEKPEFRPLLVKDAVNGMPAVRFEGQVKSKTTAAKLNVLNKRTFSLGGTGDISLFMVMSLNTPIWYGSVWDYQYSGGQFSFQEDRTDGRVRAYLKEGKSEISAIGKTKILNTGFKVLGVVYNSGSKDLSLYQNSMVIGKAKGDYKLANIGNLGVGGRPFSRHCAWNLGGDITEIMVFNRALKADEKQIVEQYMMMKYGISNQFVHHLAPRLPYAYYPSANELEVAFDLNGFKEKLAGKADNDKLKNVDKVKISIIPVTGKTSVADLTLKLNKQGRGQKLFKIPDLKDGDYKVVYEVNGLKYESLEIFSRVHFPWEGNRLGVNHKVFAPFTPVKVEGDKAFVVDREYKMNCFGLFDSVKSLGRELLDGPIVIKAKIAKGDFKWQDEKLSGKVLYPDLAEFHGSAFGPGVKLKSTADIEEDGAVKVKLTLEPGTKSELIEKMWIDIPFKDKDVPLFHFAANNSMRHNYAGKTPRGGKIIWDLESQHWCPIVWKAEKGPEDGVIWDATKIKQWNGPQKTESYPFCPYIWLGAEKRGLCWFGENDRGYVVKDGMPMQEVIRENGKVIIRIYLIQKPTVLKAPRNIVFGMQASPSKPLEKNWRSRPLASGIGPVNCWGGYWCASKYPDNHDYQIVDKIQEARKTGKVDKEYFIKRDKERKDQDKKVNRGNPWLNSVMHFAKRAADTQKAAGTYFEEHATPTDIIEWKVFEDEWSNREFERFQPKGRGNWGDFGESHTDFRIYYGNEWFKRGVSLYFDNANPKRNYQPRNTTAYRDEVGRLKYTVPLWSQRNYYKRLWKLKQEWNEKGAPYPLDMTFHMTNTQVIPFNTWTSATLDLEQRYRKDDQKRQLPWPPDYTRTVTKSGQVGSIPLALDNLIGDGRHSFGKDASPRRQLSNWAMHRVNEVLGDTLWDVPRYAAKYDAMLRAFGYPDKVKIYNYWEEKPFVKVDNDQVKWLALTRDKSPFGLLLLQNYNREPQEVKVEFPDGKYFMDMERRTVFDSGNFKLPGKYGTRMYLVAKDKKDLPPPLKKEKSVISVEDFELGIGTDFKLSKPHPSQYDKDIFDVGIDNKEGNHVLKVLPAPRLFGISIESDQIPAKLKDWELSFKIRLPKLPNGRNGSGLLNIIYNTKFLDTDDPKKKFHQQCGFNIDINENNGKFYWVFSSVSGKNLKKEGFSNIKTNLTRKNNLAELGTPDTNWHTVKISVKGKTHKISLDGKTVFEADLAVVAGTFQIGQGWRLNHFKETGLECIEIDDIVFKALD